MGKFQPLKNTVKILYLTPVLLFLFSAALIAEEADPLKLIYDMKNNYDHINDYRAIFIKQESSGGKLQKEEKIKFDFKQPFKVKMLWLTGDKKGREVAFIVGEYGNKMIVKMTGLLGRFIKLLMLDPDGAFAKKGSRHSIKRAGIGKLADSIIRVTKQAEEAGDLKIRLLGEKTVEGRKTYMIERLLPPGKYEGSPRTLIYIDQELGIPIEIERYDKDGKLYERYAYHDLEVNTDISDTEFRLKDRYKRSSHEEKEVIKKAKKLIENSFEKYESINDYEADFHKRERIDNKFQQLEIFDIKFMKPFYLYLKKIQGKWKGTEIYYSPFYDEEKIEVRPGGVIGTVMNTIRVPTMTLDITDKTVTEGNRHSIKEFGIGGFLEKYIKDFNKGIKRKEIYVEVLPWERFGETGSQVELILKNKKKLKNYYAYRTLVSFSDRTRLPVEIKVFEEDGGLLEYYLYKDLRTNIGMTEDDFEPLKAA